MAILVPVTGKYEDEKALNNVVNYVMDFDKTCDIVGGKSVSPDTAIAEMEAVQEEWNKKFGKRVHHFVLSFADGECVTFEEAYDIACAVADFYAPSYQIVFGAHVMQPHIHIHFAMNTVSFVNGMKCDDLLPNRIQFRAHVNSVLSEYGMHLRRCY